MEDPLGFLDRQVHAVQLFLTRFDENLSPKSALEAPDDWRVSRTSCSRYAKSDTRHFEPCFLLSETPEWLLAPTQAWACPLRSAGCRMLAFYFQ
jgi:hypothetical protein